MQLVEDELIVLDKTQRLENLRLMGSLIINRYEYFFSLLHLYLACYVNVNREI